MNTATLAADLSADFRRVIRPGKVKLPWGQGTRLFDVFCKIEYKAGRLSISGVEGPMENGNARGGCGQIDMHLEGGRKVYDLAPGWTSPMIIKFFAAWKEWHLNDMSPSCEHQDAAGWSAIACEEVTLYHYTLNDATRAAKKAAEERALESLRARGAHNPTAEESRVANMPYSFTSHESTPPEGYEPSKPIATWSTVGAPTEKKKLGWLTQAEHPRGIMSKPCEVCGYKYGSAWKKRAVPADVLEFLRGLPEADKKPAWV